MDPRGLITGEGGCKAAGSSVYSLAWTQTGVDARRDVLFMSNVTTFTIYHVSAREIFKATCI